MADDLRARAIELLAAEWGCLPGELGTVAHIGVTDILDYLVTFATTIAAEARQEAIEQAAKVAADAASGSEVLYDAAVKDCDRLGVNVHGAQWQVAMQLATAIRSLKDQDDGEGR